MIDPPPDELMARDAAAREMETRQPDAAPDPPRDRAGFRLRGLAMTRIETFTDAAFAFALTLLVISLDPPTSFEGLRATLLNVPAFLLSATLLMMFWWGHHVWSRRYGLEDGTTIVLSCLLVFTILIYVYPLRFLFGLMMAWIGRLVGVPFGAEFGVGAIADVNRLFIVYGIGFTAMSAVLVLLNLHAWRQRVMLGLDTIERHETRSALWAWSILVAAGLLSTAVGLVAPSSMAGLPGWVYASLAFIMPLYSRSMGRRRRAIATTDPAALAS